MRWLADHLIASPYIQSALWLFALYTYISGFRNLSPLQDMDGYYAFVLNMLNLSTNVYMSLIVPFCILIISSLSIVAEVRKQGD